MQSVFQAKLGGLYFNKQLRYVLKASYKNLGRLLATSKKRLPHVSFGNPNMYNVAMFSYQGHFLDYLGLEDMGVFSAYGRQICLKNCINSVNN